MYDKSLTMKAASVSGVPCGVISAFVAGRSGRENEEAHGRLLDVLLSNGFSPHEARGEWEGMPELCLVVPGIPEGELVEIAAEFGQEAVAYVEDGRARLIGCGSEGA